MWKSEGDARLQSAYSEQVLRWMQLLESQTNSTTGLLHSSLDYFISDAPGMCSSSGTGAAVEGTAFYYQ